MAALRTSHFDLIDSPDLMEAAESFRRERAMKIAAALGSVGLLIGALFAVAYLNFGQAIDPGPPQPPPDTHPGVTAPMGE